MKPEPTAIWPRFACGLAASAFLAFAMILARSNTGAIAGISACVLVIWAVVLVAPTWLVLEWGKRKASMGQEPASAAVVEAAATLDAVTYQEATASLEAHVAIAADGIVEPGSAAPPAAEREGYAEIRRRTIATLIQAAAIQGWELAQQGMTSAPSVDVQWTESGEPEIVFEGTHGPGHGFASEGSYRVTHHTARLDRSGP